MADSQTKPLHVDFCGLSMASPIVLLSGCVGFGEEYTRVEGFSNHDVGAVVLKGTTLEPRLGNPPHRICETPMGMLNAIGLQNPGVDAVVDDIRPASIFQKRVLLLMSVARRSTTMWLLQHASTIRRSMRLKSIFPARTSRKAVFSSAMCPKCLRGLSRLVAP